MNLRLLVDPQSLQVDVVFQIRDLFRECDPVFIGLVEHVAHHFGEVQDGGGGLLGTEVDEGIDVVEDVEEEVGIDLGAEELEFGLELLVLELGLQAFLLEEVVEQKDGQAEDHDKQRGENGEASGALAVEVPEEVGVEVEEDFGDAILEEAEDDGHGENSDGVGPPAPAAKEIGDKEVEVEVDGGNVDAFEDDEGRPAGLVAGGEDGMEQVNGPGEVEHPEKGLEGEARRRRAVKLHA